MDFHITHLPKIEISLADYRSLGQGQQVIAQRHQRQWLSNNNLLGQPIRAYLQTVQDEKFVGLIQSVDGLTLQTIRLVQGQY